MMLPVGQQLGDYRILEPIGAGGMGEVHLAENVHSRKRYALKILPRALAADQHFVHRFFDEARVMSDLRHDHIVQVHHTGQHEGVYFLVMDYVTGPGGQPESLHDRAKAAPDGRLPEADVRRWAVQIAEALRYAHERGVVHRDLKPANILLDSRGDAVLTDFGLAKAIGREFILSQIHQTIQHSLGSLPTLANRAAPAFDTLDAAATIPKGDSGGPKGAAGSGKRSSGASSILGTYDYMAPEQRGEGTGEIDPRTDIYSFGIVLYRLLTGRRPTAFASPPSSATPGISKGWDAIVARCMRDDPAQRYQSAAELLDALRGLKRARATATRWLIGVMVVAAAIVAGVMYWPAVPWATPTSPTVSEPAPEPGSVAPAKAPEATGASQPSAPEPKPPDPAEFAAAAQQIADARASYQRVLEANEALLTEYGQEVAEWAQARQAAADATQRKWDTPAQADAIVQKYQEAQRLLESAARSAGEKKQAAESAARAKKEAADREAAAQRIADARVGYERVLEANEALLTEYGQEVAEWTQARQAAADAAQERWDTPAQANAIVQKFQEAQRQLESAARSAGEKKQAAESAARAKKEAADREAAARRAAQERQDKANAALTAAQQIVNRAGIDPGRTPGRDVTQAQIDAAKDAEKKLDEGLAQQPPAPDTSALATLKRQLQPWAAAKPAPRIPTLDCGNGVTMELVLIPPGTFTMGSPESEAGRYSDEGPQRTVRVSQAFYMSKTEVTQAQWQAVMGSNPSNFKGDGQLPVECVSWDDCQEFCRKLSARTGQAVRLPSEAEWEYACRAGTATRYGFGEEEGRLGEYAWFDGNSGGKTHAVGQKKPNAWGLHDMHGNVWEWCEDVWHGSYGGAPSDGSVWTAGGDPTRRVLRGGSWFDNPTLCRAADRYSYTPGARYSNGGVRVVVSGASAGTP